MKHLAPELVGPETNKRTKLTLSCSCACSSVDSLLVGAKPSSDPNSEEPEAPHGDGCSQRESQEPKSAPNRPVGGLETNYTREEGLATRPRRPATPGIVRASNSCAPPAVAALLAAVSPFLDHFIRHGLPRGVGAGVTASDTIRESFGWRSRRCYSGVGVAAPAPPWETSQKPLTAVSVS